MAEGPRQALVWLKRARNDFSATYMALRQLTQALRQGGFSPDKDVAHQLGQTLQDPALAKQSKAYFLFREATEALVCLIESEQREVRRAALTVLGNSVLSGDRSSRQAAAEATGSLPLRLAPPETMTYSNEPGDPAKFEGFLRRLDKERTGAWRWSGRSLWAPLIADQVLVCKFLRQGEERTSLAREASWLSWLAESSPSRYGRYRVVTAAGRVLFSPATESFFDLPQKGLDPSGCCLCFWAPKDYFAYVNAPWQGRFDLGRCGQSLEYCAAELGRLAGQGVVHADPIALFHNRIQSWRRTDAGRYQWQRGGRLDRWLESCRYPNLGHAGLRDFEHLESHFEGGRHFFYAVGDHFLSLALVAGSCFRFQDPNRIGLDGQGRPIDARDLFDTSILASWLERFFLAYYRGLNGRDFPGPCPLPTTGLAQGLVEALGRDQYMQEVLREQDLEYLGPTKVAAYLQSRGLDREQAQFLSHSDQELVIHSGPHLGEFNGRLEVPALLDYIAMASSICLAGRYFLEQHLDWESEFWALVASARQDQQGLGPSLRA